MTIATLLDYGPYVWGAYGVFALALAVELRLLVVGRRAVEKRLAEARLIDELAVREGSAGARGEGGA